MTKVAILIPTLGRAENLASQLENIHSSTEVSHRVYFIAEESDQGTFDALEKLRERRMLAVIGDFGTYAKAINAGYAVCREPFVMTSDDDCIYYEGWLEAALAEMKDPTMVVGTNDLHNPHVLTGEHSTHSLVDRRYIEQVGAVIDQGLGSFLYEYDHNYTDAELIETAKARGVFAPCLGSVVEHIHPDFGGREPDETWIKTRRAVAQDYNLFEERRRLWEGGALEYEAPAPV